MTIIDDRFATDAPSVQATVDIFKGEWNSKLPNNIISGEIDLFNDHRIGWAHRLFDLENKSVLELGPLEGAHTYQVQKYGAAKILAIEGNSRAFLKCLIVKELFGLERAKFLFGNFINFLETDRNRYDVIFASGVLYHMREPLRLLELIARHTDRVLLWTHHYVEAEYRKLLPGPAFDARIRRPVEINQGTFRCLGWEYFYGGAVENLAFPGGFAPSAVLLAADDIMDFLRYVGMSKIEIADVHDEHPNGPAMSIAAWR